MERGGVGGRRSFAASQSSSTNWEVGQYGWKWCDVDEVTYLAQITSNAVGQDDNDDIVLGQLQLLTRLDASSHGATTASSNQETLLSDQLPGVFETSAVIRLEPSIDTLLIQNVRNEVVTNTLDLVWLIFELVVEGGGHSKDTAMGICSNNLDILVVLSDSSCQTGDGTTCTCSCDEGGDLAVGLCPNLFSRTKLMCLGVVNVGVLIQNDSTRDFLF